MALIFGRTSTGLLVPVLVDASGYLYINTLSTITTLPAISLAANQNIQARNHGYIATVWQKDPMQDGYSDIHAQRVSNLNAGVGTNILNSTTVPSGEFWRIEAISAFNNDNNPTAISIGYSPDGSNSVVLTRVATPGAGIAVCWSGIIHLKPTGYIQAVFTGCIAGDDLYLDLSGVRVDIDL